MIKGGAPRPILVGQGAIKEGVIKGYMYVLSKYISIDQFQ